MAFDEKYMRMAIEQAELAKEYDEVPVGAVIVKDGEVIAVGGNRKERENCAVYHAEIVAITEACRVLDNWYLDGCDMYVTLEPCPMCCGAIINSRIDNLYYGATDPKSGCVKSMYELLTDKRFNHTVKVKGGILEKECGSLLTNYFKSKREKKKREKQENK